MIPQIKPISQPNIDWTTFLKSCNEALGYSPIRGVDCLKQELSDPARMLASLAAFHDRLNIKNPITAIRDCGSLLRHLNYIFLVYCDRDLISDIREKTQLNITSTPAPDGGRVAVISGSLFDYRQATLECCVPESNFDIRYLFDGFMLYFESIGLGLLWQGHRKKPLRDRTFLLELE